MKCLLCGREKAHNVFQTFLKMRRLTKTQILYIANAHSHGERSLCEIWLSDAGGRIHPEDRKLIDEKTSSLRENPLTPDELRLVESWQPT